MGNWFDISKWTFRVVETFWDNSNNPQEQSTMSDIYDHTDGNRYWAIISYWLEPFNGNDWNVYFRHTDTKFKITRKNVFNDNKGDYNPRINDLEEKIKALEMKLEKLS